MYRKKIAAAAGIAVLAILIIAGIAGRKGRDDGYVIDKSYNIKLKDIEAFYRDTDFNDDSIKDRFAGGVINRYTLNFFMSLEERFKDATCIEDHMQKAREYLYSVMSTDEADRLLAVYETYLNYQKSLAVKSKEWGTPTSPEEAIALLHRLQEYRRDLFGRENADLLFGVSVKAEEYPIRRGAIIGNREMYGAEKEKRLEELNREMWGDEAGSVEAYAKPYTRYREKLRIYGRDLSEMSADEKQAKVREFRDSLFTPEEVQRLDEVDRSVAEAKQKEDNYYALESRIMNDPDLDVDEKNRKIRELQDQTFGVDADAFRRRQVVEKSLDMSRFTSR